MRSTGIYGAVVSLDGVHVGEHCLIIALRIAADGHKHSLGLWDGSTENAALCQRLLANLQSRELRTDRSLLVLLDGSKAVRKAKRDTFGGVALVQRCQAHKLRNVLDYLPERQWTWVKAILRRVYRITDVAPARGRRSSRRPAPPEETPLRARVRRRRRGHGMPTRQEYSGAIRAAKHVALSVGSLAQTADIKSEMSVQGDAAARRRAARTRSGNRTWH